MKPNDKAYQEAADEIRFNSGLDLSEDVCSELAKLAVDAAYAAQFKSEDYAGLVERLRNGGRVRYAAETHDEAAVRRNRERDEAADALEALLAERESLKAELEKAQDIARVQADRIGGYIKTIEDRDALLARLAPVEDDSRHLTTDEQKIFHSALSRYAKIKKPVNDEVLLAERDALKGVVEIYEKKLSGIEDEIRLAVQSAIAAIRPHIEAAERERCAAALEITSDEIRLHAGEMTAQEMRSVLAVLAWRAAAIRRGK